MFNGPDCKIINVSGMYGFCSCDREDISFNICLSSFETKKNYFLSSVFLYIVFFVEMLASKYVSNIGNDPKQLKSGFFNCCRKKLKKLKLKFVGSRFFS